MTVGNLCVCVSVETVTQSHENITHTKPTEKTIVCVPLINRAKC